jgi:hypothetical protein
MQRVDREPALQATPVTLILELSEGEKFPGSIAAQAAQLRFQRGRWHEVVLPQCQVRALLARLPAGSLARLPYPHQALDQTVSQGVVLTGAADMQVLGHTGLGLTIGVIDLGFTGLSASQGAGELPAGLHIQDYTGTGTDGTDHGTNVAEIVHDMAPDAALRLAKINSEAQLGQAMDDMVAAGVGLEAGAELGCLPFDHGGLRSFPL